MECLRGIASVHKVLVSDTLHPDYEAIITNFVTNWKVLEDKFEISCTLKIHIIETHMLDAIRESGKSFHDESDEVVERAHYGVHYFEKTHGYFVSERKMQTEIAAEKQQRMMEQCSFELKSSIIIVLLCIFLMCAIQQLQIN